MATFTAPVESQPPANIAAGLRISQFCDSLPATTTTYTFISPVCNVVDIRVEGCPTPLLSATTNDRFIVNNSRSSSGLFSSLSSTNNTSNPTISFTRSGTNACDFSVTLLSKG